MLGDVNDERQVKKQATTKIGITRRNNSYHLATKRPMWLKVRRQACIAEYSWLHSQQKQIKAMVTSGDVDALEAAKTS